MATKKQKKKKIRADSKKKKITKKSDPEYRKKLKALRVEFGLDKVTLSKAASAEGKILEKSNKLQSKGINFNLQKQQLPLWNSEFQVRRLKLRWGSHKAFHKENKFRQISKPFLAAVKDLREEGREEISLLEVGSGHGHFLYGWRRHVDKIFAFDYSENMIRHSQKALSDTPSIVGDCWNLPFKRNSFDIVVMIDVTMHIGGSWDAIAEMMRTSSGYIIFTGPSWEERLLKRMNRRLGKISWGVNRPMVERKLTKMKSHKKIQKYFFAPRTPSKAYNHKILVIKK